MNEEDLFNQALGSPPEERSAFLAGQCGDDVALRNRVEMRLQAHDAHATGKQRTPKSLQMGAPQTAGRLKSRHTGRTVHGLRKTAPLALHAMWLFWTSILLNRLTLKTVHSVHRHPGNQCLNRS